MAEAAARILIEGLVQGVWYRASARDEGHRLGLSGWARNLPDGRVEAYAEGPRDRIEDFIAWCRQGPALARVTKMDIDWVEPAGEVRGFKVGR